MDIEFETSLWTHISALLEKNSTKKEVSRNEPFSGHSYSFSNTRESSNLSIRSPVGIPPSGKKHSQGRERAGSAIGFPLIPNHLYLIPSTIKVTLQMVLLLWMKSLYNEIAIQIPAKVPKSLRKVYYF